MSHVIVLGAGVIGLCTALEVAKRGHRVTVIDRGSEERSGCSYGNAGMIVPSHFVPLAAPGMVALGLKWMWNPESPFYIKPSLDPELLRWGWNFWKAATREHVKRASPLLRDLHLRSRLLFEELAAACENDFGLNQRGLLMLCKTQRTLDEEADSAQVAREMGVPAEVLDARHTNEMDPGITMDVAGAVYYPKDCHLTPQLFMRTLQRLCKEAGVAFLWGADAEALCAESGRVLAVKTSQGETEGDEFVLCLGSWSSAFSKSVGLRLPMQAGKGYSLTLSNPRQLPHLCSILTEARVAVTPMTGGSLRFGGTMEISGMSEAINPRRVQGIINAASRYFPEFSPEDLADVEPWSGLRPCSPDGLPYLGRTRYFSNLCIATGHAMMGLSLGPVTGHIVAQLIEKEQPEFDLTLLSPDRYG
ncbi:D-amino-acid dehydrogenase [Roseimicrobium gellanilyticum]|uniref:D-amino-acid dehydrogenase n=1 Tax=Roseimicrobium gellanilyticum TaxID=748857 RepID=A0A366HVR9_9BACT|nr:FAD-dependent oxidoreductase [Roseimicrobium gellanilyticum]RBP47990.1 D-amino-acid dehydrogenase [Roseimicrobium gellanilyticum]